MRGGPSVRHLLAATLAAMGGAGCDTAPAAASPQHHARAAEGCVRTLERNGWRDVSVVSTQGIGGFEVQVILQDAGGFKKPCRYDMLHDTAFVQLP